MLLPTAADLRRALVRHAEAILDDERGSTPVTARERADSAYTLCVMTGTTDVGEAVRAVAALHRQAAAPQRAHPVTVLPVAASHRAGAARDRAGLPDTA